MAIDWRGIARALAERALLGSILINNNALTRVRGIVGVEDFQNDANRMIFAAMMLLADRAEEIDLLTIKEELRSREELASVGGSAYVSSLIDGIPDVANVEAYARIVAGAEVAN